jgi:predicted nucleotidyltransferase
MIKTMESKLEKLKRDIINVIGNKFKMLILFGSYSRGEESDFSDIDLLLIVRESISPYEKNKINEIIAKFSLENDIVVSCIDYPENIYREYNTPFLLNVKGEGYEI